MGHNESHFFLEDSKHKNEKHQLQLTEYKFSGAIQLTNTPVLFSWKQVHITFFTGKAKSSSDCEAHLNGSRVQEFAFITDCRNSFFLKVSGLLVTYTCDLSPPKAAGGS